MAASWTCLAHRRQGLSVGISLEPPKPLGKLAYRGDATTPSRLSKLQSRWPSKSLFTISLYPARGILLWGIPESAGVVPISSRLS